MVNHALHIPMQLFVLRMAEFMVHKQIGPPPPPTATTGLVLQYAILRHVRVRSHRVDWANNALESTAVFVVKMLFCDALNRGTLGKTPLRLMFTPIWACWVITFLLLCLKDRSERMFGSSRDMFFIFLLFVAFKVDDQSSFSWRVVFLVPWMWFSGLMLVAVMVSLLLLFAKMWARPGELLLPIGFLALLLSSIPQFVSYIALVRRLDGDTGTSFGSILWPNALSWLLMWGSAGCISAALRQKEAVRDALLARGAVWTAHEGVARRLTAGEQAQRRVDEMSEEEVSRLVESMMAGKPKPGRLRRVGENLYKRIASLDPALADQAAAAVAQPAAAPGDNVPASRVTSSTATPAGSAAVAVDGAASVPTGSEASDGGELGASERLSPAAGADVAVGVDSSERPTAGAGATAGGSGAGGGGALGLFRHNRVVPAPPARAGVGQAAAAAAGAASAGATAPGLDGAAGGAGGVAASATAPVAPSRNSSGVRAEAAAGERLTAAVASSGAVLKLQPREAERDVESSTAVPGGPEPSVAASAAAQQPTGQGHSTRSRQRSETQAEKPSPRRSSQAGPANNPTPAASATDAAGPPAADLAAAAGQQRRSRASPMPPRRPSSAVTPAADGADAAAGASTAAVRPAQVGAAEGSTSGSPTAAVQRPRSAAAPTSAPGSTSDPRTSAAAATSGTRVAAAESNPRQSPTLPSEDPATPPEAAADVGRGGAAAGRSPGGDGGSGGQRPSLSASGSLSRRSPAVLPMAEAEAEGEPAEGTAEGGARSTTAATAAAASAEDVPGDVGAGAASPDFSVEREVAASVPPPAADSHTPQAEASASGARGASAGDGSGVDGAASGAATAAATVAGSDAEPENACVICYDGEATCVFLECGHGGFCRRCAFLLFVRPPNECPTCRGAIDQVVEIEPVAAVGEVAKVK